MDKLLILSAIFLPIIYGIFTILVPIKNRLLKCWLLFGIMVSTLVLTIINVFTFDSVVTIAFVTDKLSISFFIDDLSKLFLIVSVGIWVLVGIFSFIYMKHEDNENRFFGFLLITLGAVIALETSQNLFTMYLSFELITLASLPLVLHSMKKDSIIAGMKYLFYSIGGAFLALLGIFYIFIYCETDSFIPGGSLIVEKAIESKDILLIVIFLLLIGFGTKAGMYPMHGWLPSAHPVAPAPASALLSGIIAKAGVFSIIRVVFYLIGDDFIKGTWVQYTWLGLALLTVFIGSMMAYKENVFKKRLAYSTVSQVSYILVGLALLTKDAFSGALLQFTFHAIIKNVLFLVAGIIIFKTGCTNVNELNGVGKKMPITMWCFTIASLGLIGIPPTCGFISKWYLAIGALDSQTGIFEFFVPIILLVSALLTGGYLLPITINGFFKEPDNKISETSEASPLMVLPLIVLSVLIIVFGIYSEPIFEFFTSISSTLIV